MKTAIKAIVDRAIRHAVIGTAFCMAVAVQTINCSAAVLMIDSYDDNFNVPRNSGSTIYSDNALGGDRRIVNSTWATAAAGALETPSSLSDLAQGI